MVRSPRLLILRILAVIILFLSVLSMPFWLTFILALAGMLYFSYFVEAVALFLLSDLIYGVPEAKFFNMVFISFIIAIVMLLIIESVKKKLRFRN
ncbi:MAG: hypothetical protein KGL67_02175 [Patescibacteria group bacterium]|nr:hypothetical protein [Patescibacteria group bacterium]